MKEDETRLRAVEEAVIEFRNIAKIVIVDIKERVRVLEARDEDLSKTLHDINHSKSEEIDSKIKQSEKEIYPAIRSGRTSIISIIIGLFGLFVGAVVYFNSQNGVLHEKINNFYKETTKVESTNSADIKSVLSEVRYIRTSLNKTAHAHK